MNDLKHAKFSMFQRSMQIKINKDKEVVETKVLSHIAIINVGISA